VLTVSGSLKAMDTSQFTLIASSLDQAQSQYRLFINLSGLNSLNALSRSNIGNYAFVATNKFHVPGPEFLSHAFTINVETGHLQLSLQGLLTRATGMSSSQSESLCGPS